MTKTPALALALALATPACGEVVDLDAALVVESDEEGVVANVHEQPDFLVSDGDRLYWAGFEWSAPRATIRSCRKTDCARSVIAYTTVRYIEGLEVAAGEVYFRPVADLLDPPTETSILSCPTTGCAGDPRVVVDVAGAFTVVGASIFFGSSAAEPPGIYKKPHGGGDPTLVVEVDTMPDRLLVRDDQLFWTTKGLLQRTSLSGEQRVETIFHEPGILKHLSLAGDAEAVYWSLSGLTSDLERCPLVGCPSGPEVVATPLRMPNSLFASDGHLYLKVELASSEAGLVTCPTHDCANPSMLGIAYDGRSTIAADERFVYAFSNQGFDPELEPPADYFETWSLRRYEK